MSILVSYTHTCDMVTKLNPLYQKLNLLKLNNVFKPEILKFMYNYQSKSLPKCFSDFFAVPSELHSYPTTFASGDNYLVIPDNKAISQTSNSLPKTKTLEQTAY